MLISRIRKSGALPAGDQRVAARMALGVVAAILCLVLVLAGASMGLTGSLAFSQPSPSGSPSGSPAGETGSIFLLNPSKAYEPVSDVQEPPDPDTEGNLRDYPKLSDKFDGKDEAYHVVAVVPDAPVTALVEAYYKAGTANEVTVGQLSPVPGSQDTYEMFWDIPASLNPGFGVFTVRLYQDTPAGFEQIGEDSVDVRLQHEPSFPEDDPPGISAAETVEFTWPSQNGPLGFYKGANAGAAWRAIVEGTASFGAASDPGNDPGSTGADQVRIMYSTTPIGSPPAFKQCASTNTGGGGPGGSETFATNCVLLGSDRPSQITALAAVAMQDQDPSGPNNGVQPAYSQESADVHRIQPYMQRVEDMEIELTSNAFGSFPTRRHIVAGSNCITYEIMVKDALDRPVQGANVDFHIRGPSDQLEYGTSTGSGPGTQSANQPPQKDHSAESSRNCNTRTALRGTHAEHNVPGGNDIKHVESTTGTGLSGTGAGFGQFNILFYSTVEGQTDNTAWIDDEPIASDSVKREPDDDLLEPAEKSDSNFAQWLPAAPAVTIDPAGATAATGTCQRFVVRVRGGARPVKGANVDVHATGPTNDLDVCDPSDASARRAPEAGTGHNDEDAGEKAHAGQPPVAQHTEGETNDQGNFIVGIISPVPGDTTLTAWYDAGEAPFDNDDLATGEATATATTNWVAGQGDAAISFLNPSPYGSAGTNVAKTRDVDDAFHVVTRVSSIEPVTGVELFYRSGSDPLVKIADAARVDQTDTWEAFWPVNVDDGTYTLVARIRDTAIVAEQSVTVRNEADPFDPTVGPLQTVEITSPLDGTRATFIRGKLSVHGVASAGAEGVVLYYTKAGSLATPAAGAWTSCGTSALPAGSAPKEFTLDCTLTGSDQPGMVTGVAALAYNCFGNCTVGRSDDSGDAHRVFGAEANPLLSIEPAETAANIGTCQKFVVSLLDQTGQPIGGENVDAHLTGPGNSGNFCSPADGTGTDRRAPDQGSHVADGDETDEAYHDEGGTRTHHTEAETTGNGRFVVGIESETTGDAQLTVWLDGDGDDLQDQGETNDISIMHWESEGACDITGTNGPDVLTGTDAPEKICGFGGNDTITGGGGNDVISGGAGADTVRGNAANDTVRGGAGNDKVTGGGGSDRLFGGGGRDRLQGHRADDRLRGNAGNDRIDGGTGRDDCGGGKGRDRLRRCEPGSRSIAARPRLI